MTKELLISHNLGFTGTSKYAFFAGNGIISSGGNINGQQIRLASKNSHEFKCDSQKTQDTVKFL